MANKQKKSKKILSSAYRKVVSFINRPWFYDKRFLITISVMCSVILWAVLATNVSPIESKTISSVPITINTAAIKENFGLEFVEVISPESLKELNIDVMVSGRKYVLSQLTANDFTAVASPTKSVTKPGSFDLTISISAVNPMLDITIENNAQQMYVKFDRFVDKDFTIENVIGVGATIPDKSDLIMGTPYANIDMVTISGPETEVNQVESVIVKAAVNKELTEGETFAGEIELFNSDGEVINLKNVTIKTKISDEVSVTIPVKTSKEFKVGVTFKNAPKDFDFSKLPITITPSTITITGSPDAFSQSSDNTYIAGEIDLAALSKNINKFTFEPSLSTGLEADQNVKEIAVTINLTKYNIKSINASSSESVFTIANYIGTRKVELMSKTLPNIRIIGPSYVVEKLSASDVIIEADMSGKETVTGSCTVNASIYVKNRTNCWAIGTYEVEVKIG